MTTGSKGYAKTIYLTHDLNTLLKQESAQRERREGRRTKDCTDSYIIREALGEFFDDSAYRKRLQPLTRALAEWYVFKKKVEDSESTEAIWSEQWEQLGESEKKIMAECEKLSLCG